jgi:YrbI family 3-deoxy-D-manno-octulosonate 8-phosphate phosphatase|tara:strand:- start:89 stop:628 length:540 start_codon:yes stop_codon:yes gene_type:complete
MINLLIIDVDGVLTDGRKVYDKSHKVLSKKYLCKDFTAIKRFVAAGIKVVMLSGDNFNKEMAQKRNIDFYCTRDLNLSLDKSQFLQIFEEKYNVPIENMAFVGDDYFDLTIIKKLDYTFCPSDSPKIVKDECEVVLKSVGGDGVIVELYDVLVNKYFNEPSLNDVLELDKKEISSEEMC